MFCIHCSFRAKTLLLMWEQPGAARVECAHCGAPATGAELRAFATANPGHEYGGWCEQTARWMGDAPVMLSRSQVREVIEMMSGTKKKSRPRPTPSPE